MTPNRKRTLDKYNASAKAKASREKYRESPLGQQAESRYQASPAGRAARRWKKLRLKYSLTQEQFSEMLGTQLNACAICHRQMVMIQRRPDSCHVDHNHTTGKVRGLLCLNCNTMIGHARESPNILRAAVSYLTGET